MTNHPIISAMRFEQEWARREALRLFERGAINKALAAALMAGHGAEVCAVREARGDHGIFADDENVGLYPEAVALQRLRRSLSKARTR